MPVDVHSHPTPVHHPEAVQTAQGGGGGRASPRGSLRPLDRAGIPCQVEALELCALQLGHAEHAVSAGGLQARDQLHQEG